MRFFVTRKIDMTENKPNLTKAQPKSIAQKCPVCNGWGTVSFKQVACHACYGRGYILIPVEKERKRSYEKK